VKSGAVSPVELTRACLDRIERVDPVLRAFVSVDADSALSTARAAEREITAGRHRGPLHGIPIAIKDNYIPLSWLALGKRKSALPKPMPEKHRIPATCVPRRARWETDLQRAHLSGIRTVRRRVVRTIGRRPETIMRAR
jgi:hypothetical protein